MEHWYELSKYRLYGVSRFVFLLLSDKIDLSIIMMKSYSDFLMVIKQNTNRKLNEYKELCRFCLQILSTRIDISATDCNSKEQRDILLDNYIIVTKRFLPTSDEYPKFVCSTCEEKLRRCALFAQQIEQNAENWAIFLRNGNDVKIRTDERNDSEWEHKPVIETDISDIKIEMCDDKVPDDEDTLDYDALELPLLASSNVIQSTKRKRSTVTKKAKKLSAVNASTEFERTCKQCDEPTFSSLARMYDHQRLMHPGIKISSCDICGTEFITKHALWTHMTDRHATSGKMHQCQYCAKRFYSDREVKVHEKYHVNARLYLCSLCGKGYNSKTRLNIHLKSKVHNADYQTGKKQKRYPKKSQPNKKIYRCEQCIPSRTFPNPSERAHHRNVVHKVFECDICKNSFLTVESLNRHKLLHSGKPRPFVCTVCNATFNQSSHLSSHFQRRHTNQKSVQCPHCDKTFFQNHELNSHVSLVHSERKRVKCSECTKDFASNKYLQRHILDKHSTEASPYDCRICGKKNGSASYLEIHRRKHHKDDE